MSDTVPVGAIVVGVDGSESSNHALDWAAVQAELEQRPLVVAHAIPPLDGAWLDADGNQVRIGVSGRHPESERLMSAAVARVGAAGRRLDVHQVVRVAEPRTLLEHLQTGSAMCTVGSRGYGRARSVLLGSVGRALTRHPQVPVVVHRPMSTESTHRGVLVGVDGSERSTPVLEFAYRMAGSRGMSLRLLHAHDVAPTVAAGMWTQPGPRATALARRRLVGLLDDLAERHPDVPVETEVMEGDPPTLLAAESGRHELLVLGAHHAGLSGLLPVSVTTKVVEHARCPVAVVPTVPA